MDYFTKWAEAVPLRDQTAASISEAIIKMSTTVKNCIKGTK